MPQIFIPISKPGFKTQFSAPSNALNAGPAWVDSARVLEAHA